MTNYTPTLNRRANLSYITDQNPASEKQIWRLNQELIRTAQTVEDVLGGDTNRALTLRAASHYIGILGETADASAEELAVIDADSADEAKELRANEFQKAILKAASKAAPKERKRGQGYKVGQVIQARIPLCDDPVEGVITYISTSKKSVEIDVAGVKKIVLEIYA